MSDLKTTKIHSSIFLSVLLGGVFFAFNSWFSYNFYHVNSFKLAYMSALLFCLFVIYDLLIVAYYKFLKKEPFEVADFPWKEALLFLAPVLATMPGYLINLKSNVTYNFDYELATKLIVMLWMVYIIRFLKTDKQIITFLILVGITMCYVWFFAFLERNDLSPFGPAAVTTRVKVTYGNINYLAGSLVPIIPVFLALALPKLNLFKGKEKKARLVEHFFENKFLYILFGLFFLLSLHTLFLTLTRAAIAASFVSIIGVLVVWGLAFFSKKKQKILVIVVPLILIIFFAGVLAILYFNKEEFTEYSRIFTFLEGKTWYGRFIAWQPVIKAFTLAPIFGYGLGSSYSLFFNYIAVDSRVYWKQRSYNHAHSEWLEFLGEGGIFGYIFFFILWGYVFYNIIKFYLHSEVSLLHKRILLGCGAGMAGFYAHAIFSVSQRMVVTNIPQFGLLAVAFIIILINKSKFESEVSAKGIFGKIKDLIKKLNKVPSIIPILLTFVLIAYLYYPWAKTQYKYVELTKKGKSFSRINELKKITDSRRDIYALDNLIRWQIEYKLYDDVLKTVAEIDKTIPNFRSIGYLEALAYFHKKDYKKAYEIIQEYIERDNYFEPAIKLAHILAVINQDKSGYLKNLEYIAVQKRNIVNEFFYEYEYHFSIDKKQEKPIKLRVEEENIFYVSFGENFFNDVLFPLLIQHVRSRGNQKQKTRTKIVQIVQRNFLLSAFNDGYIKVVPKTTEKKTAVQTIIEKEIIEKDNIFVTLPLRIAKEKTILFNWDTVDQKLNFLEPFLKSYYEVLK